MSSIQFSQLIMLLSALPSSRSGCSGYEQAANEKLDQKHLKKDFALIDHFSNGFENKSLCAFVSHLIRIPSNYIQSNQESKRDTMFGSISNKRFYRL